MAAERVYKRKEGHAIVVAGNDTLEGFFAWALKLCQRDSVNRVMIETPDFRVIWDASKSKQKTPTKKKAKRP